jgi:hypothetical protein
MIVNDFFSVVITPTAEVSKRYNITVTNISDQTFFECEFDHTYLLHPGQFGLDDTHMPSDIWVQEPLRCDVLPAGAQGSFEVDGYDVPSAYDGGWTVATMRFRRLQADTPELGDREEGTLNAKLNWKILKGMLARSN